MLRKDFSARVRAPRTVCSADQTMKMGLREQGGRRAPPAVGPRTARDWFAWRAEMTELFRSSSGLFDVKLRVAR